MATLNELKTQIVNANALGKAKIAGKGGTVAQDADTVAIMNAIDSIPSGGGSSAPTFANEITWNGEQTEESFTAEGKTFYKVSDDVIPFGGAPDGNGGLISVYTYSVKDKTNTELRLEGMISLNGFFYGEYKKGTGEWAIRGFLFLCAFFDNAEFNGITVPSVGTWMCFAEGEETNYISSVTATPAN